MSSRDLERPWMDLDELFDAWEAAWSGRDPAAFAQLCSAEVHYEDPLTAQPLEGHEAVGEHAARLWEAFPDVRLEKLGPRLGDGRMVAAPCKLLATHTGSLAGLPATNKFLIVPAVFYCELQGGRIHRARAFFDLYDAAVQLTVLPARGTLSEKALMMLRGFGLRAGR